MLKRIKRLSGYQAMARFHREIDNLNIGYIARQLDISDPFRYSPAWGVMRWHGRNVTVVETKHRKFDVFEVPATMIEASEERILADLAISLGCGDAPGLEAARRFA